MLALTQNSYASRKNISLYLTVILQGSLEQKLPTICIYTQLQNVSIPNWVYRNKG